MKITTETVARLARDVRALTGGAYGLAESARPGQTPFVTDTATGLTWHGRDCTRKAAAYYAGMIEQMSAPVPQAVRRIVAETANRHGQYADDGRAAARQHARLCTQRGVPMNAVKKVAS